MAKIPHSDVFSQNSRGNLAYQQRQQIRRHHLERKQALRKIFEMGKVVEKASFGFKDFDIVYNILVDSKKNCGRTNDIF